jgi:AcrR family transcriptional regulator
MARDKERTKARIIDAVGGLLTRSGFRAIGVNAVAEAAGVDKVLIYRYFGGLAGLLEAVAEEPDLWPTVDEVLAEAGIDEDRPGGAGALADVVAPLLGAYMRLLAGRPAVLEAVAWGVAESNPLSDALARRRSQWADEVAGRALRGRKAPADRDIQAVLCILLAAVDHLMALARLGYGFNGIELGTDAGRRRIEDAVAVLVHGALGALGAVRPGAGPVGRPGPG